MQDESKKFFEKLAGSAEDEVIKEIIETSDEENDKDEIVSIEKENSAVASQDIFEEGEGSLTIDVYQAKDEIVVESTIAGVKSEDLDVSINNDSVTIRGKREKEAKIKDEDYFYQECYWGKFSRTIILPQEIDSENSAASLKNGILTIHMPKLNRQKSKKLKVKFD
ncbi:MAG: hypothetical protein Athens071426_27 [Parcubacteria group bacterium Athens0714_26]|nr:MAG: hypothetical protein Athens101426_215 [Parcubacteria group bacterium Athens1014_26]TSD03820.1 MAG: hypothetical protein Athens071426_27 [Parcubacteria group bacterium Athens0714_26]